MKSGRLGNEAKINGAACLWSPCLRDPSRPARKPCRTDEARQWRILHPHREGQRHLCRALFRLVVEAQLTSLCHDESCISHTMAAWTDGQKAHIEPPHAGRLDMPHLSDRPTPRGEKPSRRRPSWFDQESPSHSHQDQSRLPPLIITTPIHHAPLGRERSR